MKEIIPVRIYGEKHGDHWALVSLDFGLAAQGKTAEEALTRLESQIRDFLHDITEGEDKEYFEQLFNRKAPAAFFLKYYWALLIQAINKLNTKVAYIAPFAIAA